MKSCHQKSVDLLGNHFSPSYSNLFWLNDVSSIDGHGPPYALSSDNSISPHSGRSTFCVCVDVLLYDTVHLCPRSNAYQEHLHIALQGSVENQARFQNDHPVSHAKGLACDHSRPNMILQSGVDNSKDAKFLPHGSPN